MTSGGICYIITAVKFFWFTDELVIEMAKDLSTSVLMDFYGELLTPKQLEALDFYYNQDLSLAEIASEMEVSRQGARNFIIKGEEHLVEFEDKLHLVERFTEISKIADEIKTSIASVADGEVKTKMLEDIDRIKSQL